MAVPFPLINGYRYSFASLEITIGSLTTKDFAELSYSDNVEKGEVRGAGRIVRGFTAGDYKAEASIGLYKESDNQLIAELGSGFLDVVFPLIVNYADRGNPLSTDTLVGCSFKSGAHTLSKGNDGVVVKRDIVLFKINWNGFDPIDEAAAF